jgi:hypothetical protein
VTGSTLTQGAAAAAVGAAGVSGTTGGGLVACQYFGPLVDFQQQTCSPGASVTCVNSSCLCIGSDGGFAGASSDGGIPGDCADNLYELCLTLQGSSATSGSSGSSGSAGSSSTTSGWAYQGSTGCSFLGGTGEGVGGGGITGTSGSTGTTGAVSCQWTSLNVDFGTESCSPSPTVTCVDSNCICFLPDAGFMSAFENGTPGDCQGNISLCEAAVGGLTDGG